ncbi:DUF4345 domain-containing protein [Spongiivirga citrea]|uniref:DUF4345 domain-containing protein n=1 Tax=Spongiivirga citrea TaxID=1481457 RepID=A0A6M0CGS0_9FLAO|nr:DUF4345 domain-containing protein [Spongiivirga citrea]NER16692.1 DUF4345 domain-containing protein [Spongiivirga citrea]
MKNPLEYKNLHLVSSAIIVISVGLIYGVSPSTILPKIFGFTVDDLELKNIFRAIMGLYFALGIYWIVGARNTKYWKGTTITNIVFMGGLVFGRLISTIIDGWSPQYGVGMILEMIYMFWGIYNINKYESW